jgi:hypothetical protein
MDTGPHTYSYQVLGNERVVADASRELVLAGEEVGIFSMRLTAPPEAGAGVLDLDILFSAEDRADIQRTANARMLMPTASKEGP